MKQSTKTYAKWILSGEHAVIRGYPALVFPLANFHLELSYQDTPIPLSIDAPDDIKDILTQLWTDAGLPNHGLLKLFSNIPMGKGLGASAALCLAIARLSDTKDIFAFARNLEDQFHTKSSGLDIIGVSTQVAQYFQKGRYQPLTMNWRPIWTLTHSGEQGHTNEAVKKVQSLNNAKLDEQMAESVLMIAHALKTPGAIEELAQGMLLANDCFLQWGLITNKMQSTIDHLYAKGAKAVKPTGSGGGGYLLSLWDKQTSEREGIDIILPNDKKFHPV